MVYLSSLQSAPRHAVLLLKVLALAVLGLTRSALAIDLTPVPGERIVDGVAFKQLVFHDKGREITYQPPAGWNYSGGADSLRLTPGNTTQASAEIQQLALKAPQALDEPNMKLLREQELKKLSGALEVTVLGEEHNSLQFKGRQSYGLTLSYVLNGRRFKANILFANAPDNQLRFRVVAPAEEFDDIFLRFRGSLFTLHGI